MSHDYEDEVGTYFGDHGRQSIANLLIRMGISPDRVRASQVIVGQDDAAIELTYVLSRTELAAYVADLTREGL